MADDWITAESADGVTHQFPAGTSMDVIDRVMKGYATAQAPAPAPEPPEPESLGVGDEFAAAGKGFARGVASLPSRLLLEQTGALATGAGIGLEAAQKAEDQAVRERLDIMDKIERGEGEELNLQPLKGKGVPPSPQFKFAQRYFHATPEERKALRQETLNEIARPEETLKEQIAPSAKKVGAELMEAGAEAREFVERQIPMTEAEEASVGGMVGTLAAEVPAYIGAFATAGVPGVVAYSGMDAFTQTFREAKKAGADDETAATAATLSGFVQGGLDAVPGVKMARVIPKALREETFRAAREIVEGAGTMLAFSQLSMLVDNAIAKDTYDPDRDLMQGVGDPKTMAAQAITGGLPAGAGGVARAVKAPQQRPTPTPEDVADTVMEAETVEDAILTARGVVDSSTIEPQIEQARELGTPEDARELEAVGMFARLQEGRVEQDQAGNWFYIGERGEMPIREWDGVAREDTIPAELAQSQRDVYGRMGLDVVYFEDSPNAPFDGAFDPQRPDTIFLSSNPKRNAAMVGAHEVTHALDSVTTPNGVKLGDLFLERVEALLTEKGWQHARDTFLEGAPRREAFPEGPDGDARHDMAVKRFLVTEMGADIGGEAPKFASFTKLVVDEVEARYGQDVASGVLRSFMDQVRQAIQRMRTFFFGSPEAAEYAGGDTVSQNWVTNLEELHGILAKMYAERFGTAAEKESVRLAEMREMAQRDLFRQEFERPAETPPRAEPTSGDAVSTPTVTGAPLDARITPEGQRPRVEEITGRLATLRRWLGELDQQRREDARTSPEAKELQDRIDTILGKVRGVENRLTKTAKERLEKARVALDDLLNPVEDSPDMVRVREAIAQEQERLARAAAVGTPSPGMERALEAPPAGQPAAPEAVPVRGRAVMPQAPEPPVAAPEPVQAPLVEPTQLQREQAAIRAMQEPRRGRIAAERARLGLDRPTPEPSATPEPTFEQRLREAKKAVWADKAVMGRVQRGLPRNEQFATDVARERIMREDAGPLIRRAIEEDGVPERAIPEIAKIYRQEDGESVEVAFDRAVDRWVSKEEAEAALAYSDEDVATYDMLKAEKGTDPLLDDVFARLEEMYTGRPRELPGDENIPFGDNEASGASARQGEAPAPTPVRPEGAEDGGEPGSRGPLAGEADTELTQRSPRGAFDQQIERLRAERAPAERLVRDAIAQERPRLVLDGPDGRSIALTRGTEDAPYRITSFDKDGPVGHRDYSDRDGNGIFGIGGMVQEVHIALRNGFKVRGSTSFSPRRPRPEGEPINSAEYEEAQRAFSVVSREYDAAVKRYRAREIGDEEFLPIKDRFEAAREAEHQAFLKEQAKEPALVEAPEASREDMAARRRRQDKTLAEAAMRGRKVARKPQESADDTPLFGGERQRDMFGEEAPPKPKQGTLFSPREPAPPFYSAVIRGVENLKIAKATPGQWEATLRNMPGIKAEERQWIGLDDWLRQQPKSVTKEEVLDFLRANQVQVREVTLGEARPVDRARLQDLRSRLTSLSRDEMRELQRLDTAAHPTPTKYGFYTLPGGENYRELLLTLPSDPITGVPGTDSANYRSPHWDEANVLAHVRFDDRTGLNGEKILHIAEVQSDWHQAGRKRGYRGSQAEIDAALARYDQTFGRPQEERDAAFQEFLRTSGEIPDAPFKTTWPEFAMKRMIRWAAEHGYDRISWDTGATNAERYDLSKKIRSIRLRDNLSRGATRPRMEGPFTEGNLTATDHEGNKVIDRYIRDPNELPDIVGKEVTDRLLAVEPNEAQVAGLGVRERVLGGLDLKVGGEGMTAFYDRQLPIIANKIGKRFGAKVEEVDVPVGDGETAAAHSLPITDAMRRSVVEEGQTLFSPRQRGIPADAADITTFRSDELMKAHRDYRAAKAGDQPAAERLINDLVRSTQLERALLQFKPDTIFLPVIAEEATGHNAIPHALAARYANAVGGELADGIVQANRAFHTGADPMERLISRPVFNGEVEAGRNYVLVDDVSVLGGTLAELANHIQANGGKVVGVVTLANASRSGQYIPRRGHLALIERRFGDEIRQRFDVEPGALTGDEAQYLVNFRDVDALRARIAKAESEREQRLLSKGLRQSGSEEGEVKRSPRPYTPEQRQAIDNAFAKPTTTRERISAAREDAGRKFVRTMLDPYIGLRREDPEAYMAARLANSSAGAFHYFLEQGPLKFTRNAIDADARLQNGGVNALRRDLGAEEGDFMKWVVGNRAERLKAEDRENLLKDVDIAGLKSLARGRLSEDYVLSNGQTTRSREAAYLDALKRLDSINRNVMNLAVEAGLVKRETADALIANPFYVPFYRAAVEAGSRSFAGAQLSPGMVRQYAFKKLKGGQEKLRDPWENAVGNWEHMIDAAMRNRTAVRVLNTAAARALGAVEKVSPQDYHNMTKTEKAKTVWVMEEGKKTYYSVEDPMILTAVSALETASSNGFFMRLGRGFAKTLRYGVTANPLFAARTAIRDTQNAIAVSEISANPFKNIGDGFDRKDIGNRLQNVARAVTAQEKLWRPLEQEEASALAGGALMRLGAWHDGGVDSRNVTSANKFWRYVTGAMDSWKDVVGAAEDINRMAIYRQLRAKGLPHDYASFQGRDLQDFTLKGAASWVRTITELTPFLNARMQGLYKIGRAAAESDKSIAKAIGKRAATSLRMRLYALLGTMTLAGLALDAAYRDDEDYQKRTEFDRQTYYWFKIGKTQFRIPKGFELAALSSLAVDGVEVFFDPEMTGQRVVDNFWKTLGTNLQVQAPAFLQPGLDILTNTRGTGGRIEPMGTERLQAEQRYTIRNTMFARVASEAMNKAVRAVSTSGELLSPIQIDYLIDAYTGWLGTNVVGMADKAVRSVTSEPERPERDFMDTLTQGMVRTDSAPQSRYVDMLYQQSRAIEQAYNTYRELLRRERPEEAKRHLEANKDLIAKYPAFTKVKRLEGDLNRQIRQVTNSPRLSAEQKRVQIMRLQAMKNRAAERLFSAGARP